MIRTVSATEAKAKLSELMRWAAQHGDIIVESHGTPQVVLVSYADYAELQQLRERTEREAALDRLRALAEEVQAQNRDLSATEAERLADEIGREAIDGLVAQGNVRFEL